MTGHRHEETTSADPLAAARARGADLEARIDAAPDEQTAQPLGDELHQLLDRLDDVAVLRPGDDE